MRNERLTKRRGIRSLVTSLTLASLAWSITDAPAQAQNASIEPILPDLTGIVKDEDWARILGKALFWEQWAGSDGMACASCHFSAGADSRLTNQLSPGLLDVTLDVLGNQIPDPDTGFGATEPASQAGLTASGNLSGSNYTVEPNDFPFHQLADRIDRNSEIVITTNDRMSSSGSFDATFVRAGRYFDHCRDFRSDVFHVNGRPARTVEPRNTPTTINAVFNHRNFWDGRAKNIFNGKGVFGRSEIKNDPAARIISFDGNRVEVVAMEIDNASLASQAVGPPLSNLEMSCDGRTFPDVGFKILSLVRRPLATQSIHPDDSLLGAPGPKGSLVLSGGRGLSITYEELVKRAFEDAYWAADGRFVIQPNGTLVEVTSGSREGFTQMEQNFSLFWGLSILLYEATLISDQSRFDTADAAGCVSLGDFQFPGGEPASAQACVDRGLLTEKEADGLALFFNQGNCGICHVPPLFTNAAQFVGQDGIADQPVNRTLLPPFTPATVPLADRGFLSVGSRPVDQDLGIGGSDPWGEPLSFARQLKRFLQTGAEPADGSQVDPCNPSDPNLFESEGICGITGSAADDLVLQIDGTMKTPGLRNIALTPPYFHYGGYSTLEQAVDFYVRGGSRREASLLDPTWTGDDSGTGPNGDLGAPANLHPDFTGDFGTNTPGIIEVFDPSLDPDNGKDLRYGIEAMADFLRTLTDFRAACDQAPFDHPSLLIPNGHNPDGSDIVIMLPAVGEDGYAGTGFGCLPNSGDLFALQNRIEPAK